MLGERLLSELREAAETKRQERDKVARSQAARRDAIQKELAKLDAALRPYAEAAAAAEEKVQLTQRAMLGAWIPYQTRQDKKPISGERLIYDTTKSDGWNSKVWLRRVTREKPLPSGAHFAARRETYSEWECCIALLESDGRENMTFGEGTGDDHADFIRLSKIVDKRLSELGYILCD